MDVSVQLITYVDRLGEGDLHDLRQLLGGPLQGLFGGVHLLPFFDPIDGADAGFDPTDHTRVDPRLGDWEAVRKLGEALPLMADLICNHISSASPQFQDFLEKGSQSAHRGLFLTFDDVFPQGAREADILKVYRPRPWSPFSYTPLKNGEKVLLWNTFTPQQIDINVEHPQGRAYLRGILDRFAEAGIKMIRLDAAGYAIKRPGTSCFMIPETFEFISELTAAAHQRGMEVLVEIHAYYQQQIEIARRVDYVYDFALPPLVLHGLHQGTARRLKQWLAVAPRNCVTVLATHDGIGVIDVGPESREAGARPGLLDAAEIDALVEGIHAHSQGQSRLATGAAASNLDLYQVNCTFYDALGRNDQAYLLARLIQFFVPGVPQVYYVGLLAGENDLNLLDQTQVGRDINRAYFSPAAIEQQLQKPVVQQLLALIRFRNAQPAFRGDFTLLDSPDTVLHLRWEQQAHWAEARIDLEARAFVVSWGEGERRNEVRSFHQFPPIYFARKNRPT
jgi:sucrose phosphorylase